MSLKKGKFRGRLYAICLIVCIFACLFDALPFEKAGAENSDPRKAYEEKLKAAKEQKAELEKKKKEQEELIAEFSEEKENIEKYIEELDLKLNDISLRIFELKKEIEATEKSLEITKKELAEAKKKEKNQYNTMKKRIAYIYENGETSYIEILLNSGSISDFLNQVEYVNDITRYDNTLLDKYKEAKKAVEDHEALLEASLEELNLMKESEQLEQATIQELVDLKGAEIEKLTEKLGVADEYLFNYISEISSKDLEIEKIIDAEQKRIEEEERKRKEEEERMRREEEARKAAQAEVSKPTTTSGYNADAINHITLTDATNPYKMTWPLPGDYRVYSRFGPRIAPTEGASTFHKGWDIGGEFGAPMVAVLAGTVVSTEYNSSGGNVVRVDHGNGYISVYCHCSKYLVSPGDYVRQGQKIALVGDTGVSTAPHLHFGIEKNGEFVDPAPYIGYLE